MTINRINFETGYAPRQLQKPLLYLYI